MDKNGEALGKHGEQIGSNREYCDILCNIMKHSEESRKDGEKM
jgi:hypothetical protein